MKEINQAFITHLRGLGYQAFMDYAPERINGKSVERPYVVVITESSYPNDTMGVESRGGNPFQGDITFVRLEIYSKENTSDEAHEMYRRIDRFFNYVDKVDFVINNRRTVDVWREDTSGPQRDPVNGWVITTRYRVESTA